MLFQSLYHVMRDPKYWSKPDDFNPDRFLQDGKFVPNERVVPFGIGKRYCLGKSLAEKEFFLFFTSMVQAFNFETPKGEVLPKLDFEDIPVLGVLRSSPKYNVVLKIRE